MDFAHTLLEGGNGEWVDSMTVSTWVHLLLFHPLVMHGQKLPSLFHANQITFDPLGEILMQGPLLRLQLD